MCVSGTGLGRMQPHGVAAPRLVRSLGTRPDSLPRRPL
jgi:hypothetical protein